MSAFVFRFDEEFLIDWMRGEYARNGDGHNPYILWNVLLHLVINVEYIIGVDKQGRIVIPAPIREALGLKGDGKASVRLNGAKIIIELLDENLEKRVEEWRALSLKLHAEPFIEEVEDSWKWMSREYAERKLGIR